MGGAAQGAVYTCQASTWSGSASTPPGRPRTRTCRPMTTKATAKAGTASLTHRPAASSRIHSDALPASPSPGCSGRYAPADAISTQAATLASALPERNSRRPAIS